MPPVKVYGIGSLGVNVDNDPFAVDDRELRQATNAIDDPLGGGLSNRPGLAPFNHVAAADAVLGGVGVPIANLSGSGTRFFYVGRGPTS